MRKRTVISTTMRPFVAVMASSSHGVLLVGDLGRVALEAVTPAVYELLDGEQRDQDAGERDRGVERGDRGHRRHAEAAKTLGEIDETEIDHAECGEQNDAAIEYLG